jgi:hypothetical protein
MAEMRDDEINDAEAMAQFAGLAQMRARAAGADPAAIERILAAIPDVPPDDGDEMPDDE